MLEEARELVETTWRGAESLDARASSLLGATGGLGAAALGGLTFGLDQANYVLMWGASVSLVVFLTGAALAAWLSRGQKLFPKNFGGHVIANDSAAQKSTALVEAELARLCDKHFAQNELTNARRSQLLSFAALSIPVGLAAGALFAALSQTCLFAPETPQAPISVQLTPPPSAGTARD